MNRNYFQIFAIEPDLKIDATALRNTLHQLARKYHPDLGQNANQDQEPSLAEINVGYEVLRDFKKRMAYLLFLYRGKECKMELGTEFLLEMLELNERIQDWQANPLDREREELLRLLKAKDEELRQEYQELWQNFNLNSCSEAEVKSLEHYLAQQQYLDRLQQKLKPVEDYV